MTNKFFSVTTNELTVPMSWLHLWVDYRGKDGPLASRKQNSGQGTSRSEVAGNGVQAEGHHGQEWENVQCLRAWGFGQKNWRLMYHFLQERAGQKNVPGVRETAIIKLTCTCTRLNQLLCWQHKVCSTLCILSSATTKYSVVVTHVSLYNPLKPQYGRAAWSIYSTFMYLYHGPGNLLSDH